MFFWVDTEEFIVPGLLVSANANIWSLHVLIFVKHLKVVSICGRNIKSLNCGGTMFVSVWWMTKYVYMGSKIANERKTQFKYGGLQAACTRNIDMNTNVKSTYFGEKRAPIKNRHIWCLDSRMSSNESNEWSVLEKFQTREIHTW